MKTFFTAMFAAILSLSLAIPATAQAPAALAMTSQERFSVEVMGEGPDVIFIPGLSTPREVWRETATALQGDFRVHLVQLRGFGEPAGANAEGPVLEPFVDELAGYISDSGLQDAAVVGHSAGGLAALLLGARHKDAGAKLMIVDSLPFFGVLAAGQPNDSMTVEMIEPMARMIRDQVASMYGSPMDPRAVEANIAGQSLKRESLPALREWGMSADPRVTAQLLYDDLTTDLRQEIGEIAVPVTVVFPWSESGPGKERRSAFYRSQYEALPDARFVAVGDSAHFIMLDQPDALLEAIREFLGS